MILFTFLTISGAVPEEDVKTGYWLYTNLTVDTDKMTPEQSMIVYP